MQDALRKELRFAAIGTLILDVLVWLVTLPFLGFGIAMPLGLLCGSAGMYINLLLLRRSIHRAVHQGKTQDWGGYILRCLVASLVMAAGMCLPFVNGLGAVLPFLYPKILFGLLSFRQ